MIMVSTRLDVLRQLQTIHGSVSRPVHQPLMTSLDFSHLDYDNATLAIIPQQLLQ